MLKNNDTPDAQADIEDRFVNFAIDNAKALTIFLVNGIKLEGNIIGGKIVIYLKEMTICS